MVSVRTVLRRNVDPGEGHRWTSLHIQ
jgi:hypothetical protein